jgi:hypothetical protein
MDWFLSATSCLMLWLMGDKSPWGPRVGIVNQFLWFYYAISIHEWGLIIGALAYLIVHIRNLRKWEKEKNVTPRPSARKI